MALESTLAYKNDDGEVKGIKVSGIVYYLPEAISNAFGDNYGKIVKFIENASKKEGVITVSLDKKLEKAKYKDPGKLLTIVEIATNGSDIDYFVKDNGEIVSYKPKSIITADTSSL